MHFSILALAAAVCTTVLALSTSLDNTRNSIEVRAPNPSGKSQPSSGSTRPIKGAQPGSPASSSINKAQEETELIEDP